MLLIYVVNDPLYSIGWLLLHFISGVLTQDLCSLSWDGKQRHLVYMKKASTLISHSTAAWPDPWLQSLRHIFLPTRDCPFTWHGAKSAGLQLQQHSIEFVSDKWKTYIGISVNASVKSLLYINSFQSHFQLPLCGYITKRYDLLSVTQRVLSA